MTKQIKAIYEKGVFKPLTPVDIPIGEGQQVSIIIESESTSEEILDLAAQVYNGLSEQQIKEIEEIALSRQDFFDSGQ
jgi:predicted DNA-binding antitoxin AbrB/MazE fold protein